MNLKNKSPFAYMILILAVIAIIGMGCVDSDKTPEAEETPVTTPHETVATTPVETSAKTPAPTPKPTQAPSVAPHGIQCDLCHTNSEDLIPHKEGGKYCDQCHGDQVHPIHIGSGTVNLECQICHGSPEKLSIPKASEGQVSCVNCHAAPPDSVKPSNGDLIEIHLSRDKYCNTCHGNDIGSIHKSLMTS